MRLLRFIFSLAIDLFIKSITRPRTVYTKLAVTALLLSGGAFITPFWQQAIAGVLSTFSSYQCDTPIPSIASGSLFLALALLFAFLSQRNSTYPTESIVDTKSISPPVKVGSASVYCYCGSVMAISGVDVIVTSENTNLHMGSISGTSVSGRVRRLAASFNSDGTLNTDHLQEKVEEWKSSQMHAGPYALGLCISAHPFNSAHLGVKSIIHAIALEKRDSGINIIEEAANRKIIDFAIEHCINNNFSSIFIPIFGLGSGGIPKDEAISKTLLPLIGQLSELEHSINVYIGTYRLTDAALVASKILRSQ
ncbi:hypothetical protein [Pseudomonas sp. GW101-3H06]|uniref:hypothetical protein n=1 Tax=Pseudomonas sp. GW101-3H06 TaxID=2751347 RepID=UPI001A923850|nr:hypothetical protein [Pseudomonas sp. GW101-3H06]